MLGPEPSLLMLIHWVHLQPPLELSISGSGNILLMILAYRTATSTVYLRCIAQLYYRGLWPLPSPVVVATRMFLVGTRVLRGGRLPEIVLSYPIISRPTGTKVFSARVRSRNKAQPKFQG